jgi:hypothetical protein
LLRMNLGLDNAIRQMMILARLRLQPTNAWGLGSGQRTPGSRKTEAMPLFMKPLSG